MSRAFIDNGGRSFLTSLAKYTLVQQGGISQEYSCIV